jgi:hypothetical protein
MRDKQYHHRDVQRKLVDPPLRFRHCVGCNSAAVDEVKYRTSWSAVDGRPFTRINTGPVDDRANRGETVCRFVSQLPTSINIW